MGVGKRLFQISARFLSKRGLYLSRSLTYHDVPAKLDINLDFARYATLELCFEEINRFNVKGNIAELGVFQGDFAKRLNRLFPDRKLYLFDTFEGFSDLDTDKEQSNQYSSGEQDFSGTSVSEVLGKMPHQENCIIRKGYFPDTAEGIEDTFCFVSIDADLYKPIKSGLEFFYPRLEKGGYIFVHDFNNDEYKGAKEAVYEFCAEYKIAFVPVPDMGGTVVISKQ